MDAKEFIESEIKKDAHLKSHIERMDAVQQLEVIGLLERYNSKLHQPTVISSVCDCSKFHGRNEILANKCISCGEKLH